METYASVLKLLTVCCNDLLMLNLRLQYTFRGVSRTSDGERPV